MDLRISKFFPEIVKRFTAAGPIRQIIVFGSHARGTSTADSDLDLLVIEKAVSSRHQEMVRLRRLLSDFDFPIDVLVVSEAEFNDRSDLPSNVYYWAKREGKIIYDAD